MSQALPRDKQSRAHGQQATNMRTLSEVQTNLAENLWLLRRLGLREYSYPWTWDPTESQALHVLDAVALYLSNDEPDADVATFYTPTTSTLFLVKGGSLKSEDTTALETFLDKLQVAKGLKDLLPFLAQRSAAKVNKRIQQLREVCSGTWDCLKDICGTNSADYLETCRRVLESGTPFSNTAEAHENFSVLVKACHMIRAFIPFFRSLETYERLDTIKRRFEKIARYYDARFIIPFWKRHRTNIHFVWVPDIMPKAPRLLLGTRSVGKQQVEEALGYFTPKTEIQDRIREHLHPALDRMYPEWRGQNWPTFFPVTFNVHVEIRLILHLVGTVFNDPFNLPSGELFIGCSRRSCLCCTLWIDEFNALTGMQWMTRLSHAYPRLDWAFPDIAGRARSGRALGAGEAVFKGVREKIGILLRREVEEVSDRYACESDTDYVKLEYRGGY